MKTYFDADQAKWNINAASRLPGHDVFYGTPLNRPQEGLPMGDGDTGSLLWLAKDALHIHIGKSDLWQDAPAGSTPDDECYNSNKETGLTCQKHAGEIVIRFSCPVFDYMYQKEFGFRLSLSDAAVCGDARTPFGSVSFRAFASHGAGVSVLEADILSGEGECPEITLSRWGSRTLWRWYCQQPFAPECGLEGTDADAGDGRMFVTQDLGTTKFCLGLSVADDAGDVLPDRINSHTACVRLDRSRKRRLRLMYAVRLGETTQEARRLCAAALDAAEKTGAEALFDEHRREWAEFWSESFIAVPDDYLENVYYIYLYLMNSGSRGAWPMHFMQGPWGFYHDFVPWTYYFHYNMQHLYAPLDPAGHGELAENYYRMRRAGLDAAKKYAKRIKGRKGAFYHDVTDRYGRGADYSSLNTTPGSQIAMMLRRHAKFTGDGEFMQEYALPVMRAAAEYYLDLLEEGDDGLLHTGGTSGYEGSYPMTDTLTDNVMIRVLFADLAEYAEPELKARLTDALARLPEHILVPMTEGFDVKDGRYMYGIGKGRIAAGDSVLAIGRNDAGVPLRLSTGAERMLPEGESCFPYVELSPLYPGGELGLGDRGTPLFDAMVNQIMLQRPPAEKGGMQWNLLTVYLARMGMGDELYEMARQALDVFQAYGNGFNAEQEEPDCLPPFQARQWYSVTNTDTGKTFRLSPSDFAHFDFETVPVISQALTESLIQSHEGVIRIAPALPEGASAAFSLYAEGGFLVTAEVSPEGYAVTAGSLRGGKCLIDPPGKDAPFAYIRRAGTEEFRRVPAKTETAGREEAFAFDGLCAGDTLLLCSVPKEDLETVCSPAAPRNRDMKTCGKAHLGSPALMCSGEA